MARTILLGAVAAAALAACKDEPVEPLPSSGPPRLMTQMDHAHLRTAQLDLPRRPEAPPPGPM